MELRFSRPAYCRARFISALAISLSTLFVSALAAADDAKDPLDKVIARRGTATVTMADFDAVASKIPEAERANVLDNGMRLETALSGLLLTKQIADEARSKNADEDPVIKAKVQLAVDERLAALYVEKTAKELPIPQLDQLARETYTADRSNYIEKGTRDARHILISLEKHGETEGLELANKVLKEASAKGASFEDLVKTYSEDASKDINQGEMKDANSEKYDPSFAKAVQALKKVGELSPPVRTKFGFHIIKLERAVPDHQLSFEEAKPQIVARLRADFVDKYKRDLVDRLRNEKLDADPEAVAALRTRYERPASTPPATPAPAPAQNGTPTTPGKSH